MICSDYGWDSSEEWREYLRKFEITSSDQESLLQKVKVKFYKQYIDPDFDASLVAGTSAGGTPPPRAERKAPPTEPLRKTSTTVKKHNVVVTEYVLAIAHALLVITAVLSPMSTVAYFWCCRISLLVHFHRLIIAYGFPKLRPFPQALQPWFQSCSQSTEAFYILLSGIMINNRKVWMGVAPMALLALYHVSAFLYKAYNMNPLYDKMGMRRLHAYLSSHQEGALQLNANIEVYVGFAVMLSILTHGIPGIMQTYVVWNQLRLRYWTPGSSKYHQAVWRVLNQRVQPLLMRVPIFQRIVTAGTAWFQQAVRR